MSVLMTDNVLVYILIKFLNTSKICLDDTCYNILFVTSINMHVSPKNSNDLIMFF